MRTNILSTAIALSDRELLARIDSLAGKEREATAELVAHLAALEQRPSLYAAEGYGSLFDYCTRALRLSEDAACSRIAAVRACRRFPDILDHLASGAMTLTSVRLVGPHLTQENHEGVVARARNKARGEIEALVAELAPKPDVPASARRLPGPRAEGTLSAPSMGAIETAPMLPGVNGSAAASEVSAPRMPAPSARPTIEALSPRRYRVQFTIGQDAHDQLRRVQALLRREIPNGDPGEIFERALDLLAKEVEKAKLGAPRKERSRRPGTELRDGAYEKRIRFETDNGTRLERPPSRHIPRAIKRAVWIRDSGVCAFVSTDGRRCAERSFLELHHIHPYAWDGPATAGNISLRCRRHNQYEAELIFGPRERITVREGREPYGPALHGAS